MDSFFKRLITCHSYPHACCGALFTPLQAGLAAGRMQPWFRPNLAEN